MNWTFNELEAAEARMLRFSRRRPSVDCKLRRRAVALHSRGRHCVVSIEAMVASRIDTAHSIARRVWLHVKVTSRRRASVRSILRISQGHYRSIACDPLMLRVPAVVVVVAVVDGSVTGVSRAWSHRVVLHAVDRRMRPESRMLGVGELRILWRRSEILFVHRAGI